VPQHNSLLRAAAKKKVFPRLSGLVKSGLWNYLSFIIPMVRNLDFPE